MARVISGCLTLVTFAIVVGGFVFAAVCLLYAATWWLTT